MGREYRMIMSRCDVWRLAMCHAVVQPQRAAPSPSVRDAHTLIFYLAVGETVIQEENALFRSNPFIPIISVNYLTDRRSFPAIARRVREILSSQTRVCNMCSRRNHADAALRLAREI